jgi:hypothetical protein
MLVAASMAIWGTQVSALQFFGYSIALGGMVHYKLGAETLKTYAAEAGRQWAEFGNSRPVLRKISIIVLVVFALLFLLGGVAPTYAPDMVNDAAAKVGTKMGMTTV